MRKGKNRYIVEVNDWGCGLMIKDTQTGREIDAPDDEVITLCIKEMNSLAKELDTVRSVAQENQTELKATRIENARLKAEVERLTFVDDFIVITRASIQKLIEEGVQDEPGEYEERYLIQVNKEGYIKVLKHMSEFWHAAKEGKQP